MSPLAKCALGWGAGMFAAAGVLWASAASGATPTFSALEPRFLAVWRGAGPAEATSADDVPPEGAAFVVVHGSLAAKCPGVAAALAAPEARDPDARPFRPVFHALADCVASGAVARVRVAADDAQWPGIDAALDRLGVDGTHVRRAPTELDGAVHVALDVDDPTHAPDPALVRMTVTRGEVVTLVTDDDL